MAMDPTLPLIHNKVAPSKIPKGYIWLVSFELPAAATDNGWIIQELYSAVTSHGATNHDKYHHYWEAWPVNRGQKRSDLRLTVEQALLGMGFTQPEVNSLRNIPFFNSTASDVFANLPALPNTKGNVTVIATAAFYPVDLPDDFIENNPKTQAKSLRSTIEKPSFWQGNGSYRFVSYTWDYTVTPNKKDLVALRRSNWKLFQGASKN